MHFARSGTGIIPYPAMLYADNTLRLAALAYPPAWLVPAGRWPGSALAVDSTIHADQTIALE